MTDATLTAAQPAPLLGREAPPSTVLAAVGALAGDAVLRAAELLAGRSGASCAVLSVVEPLPVYNYGPEGALIPPALIEELIERRADDLRDKIERVCSASALPALHVRYGEPADVIAAEAAERDAGLIVMGIGPHRAVDRLLATETTVATIRRARCPVLALSGHMTSLPRTAVIATDFGATSVHAARRAMPLLADGATVYLLHVWERTGLVDPVAVDADRAYERDLPARFERLRALIGAPASLAVKAVQLVGNTAECVLEFAHTHGADLVVTGTHGRGFVERFFVGSVATAILRRASCSVLVAPEPPAAEHDQLELLMNAAP